MAGDTIVKTHKCGSFSSLESCLQGVKEQIKEMESKGYMVLAVAADSFRLWFQSSTEVTLFFVVYQKHHGPISHVHTRYIPFSTSTSTGSMTQQITNLVEVEKNQEIVSLIVDSYTPWYSKKSDTSYAVLFYRERN
jgi:hypothetical protein